MDDTYVVFGGALELEIARYGDVLLRKQTNRYAIVNGGVQKGRSLGGAKVPGTLLKAAWYGCVSKVSREQHGDIPLCHDWDVICVCTN